MCEDSNGNSANRIKWTQQINRVSSTKPENVLLLTYYHECLHDLALVINIISRRGEVAYSQYIINSIDKLQKTFKV